MSRATPEQIAALPHCQDCSRYMRPFRSHAADWPGTVARSNAAMCNTCLRRRKAQAVHAEHAERERARDIRTAVNLRAFIAERRRRGVPAEGFRVDA